MPDTSTNLLLLAAIEFSDDAIVTKTLDGIITSWNKGAERLFGFSPKEAIGASIFMIVPEDRQDEERLILERLSNGEHIDHFETFRQSKAGRLIEVSIS